MSGIIKTIFNFVIPKPVWAVGFGISTEFLQKNLTNFLVPNFPNKITSTKKALKNTNLIISLTIFLQQDNEVML
ncbi:MAG: hypothetical protein LBH59_10555 [Planctomycetaceae bacterium]|nr:hypothetical protein [Planctomycetaceae bacterium]